MVEMQRAIGIILFCGVLLAAIAWWRIIRQIQKDNLNLKAKAEALRRENLRAALFNEAQRRRDD